MQARGLLRVCSHPIPVVASDQSGVGTISNLDSNRHAVGDVTPAILQLQIWPQEFVWTEADKPIKLNASSIMVPNNPSLAGQPIFCFETMMNLLYWSCFAYEHDRVRKAHQMQIVSSYISCQKGWPFALAIHRQLDSAS